MSFRTLKLSLITLVSVLTSSVLVNAAAFFSDFDSGLPPGASVVGSASWQSSGGIGNSGMVQVTPGANGQAGGFTVADFAGGIAVTNFRAKFKLLIGGGTCCTAADGVTPRPADGMSFNFAAGI